MTFVINRWVRGADFFGRSEILGHLNKHAGKPRWVLGNRRVGKTSLLRQIVWLAREGQWEKTQAIYWDLQGAGTVAGLKDSFLECLEDHPDIADLLELDVDTLEDMAFGQILGKFRRRIKSFKDGTRFFLLVDECEELVDISKEEPQVLSWFRKLGHTSRYFSLVLAGSLRFMDLDESQSRTSPLMPDYLPPVPLGPFAQADTEKLLARNGLDLEMARRIHHLTFGNPHLVQVVGELYSRLKQWDMVLQEMKHNRVSQYFFQSNFQCLPEAMRDWFSTGTALEKLRELAPGNPKFDYSVQSALIRQGGNGIEINPMLHMELGEAPELFSQQAPVKQVSARPQVSQTWASLGGFFQELKKASPPLTVLPLEAISKEQLDHLNGAHNPPSLEFMASLGEPKTKMVDVLRGASPEYILENPADEKTAVYLLGLFIYFRCFGCFPFEEETEPWTLAGNLADSDVAVRPDKAVIEMPAKLGMILLRCLKANPELRYATLDAVADDLGEVIQW